MARDSHGCRVIKMRRKTLLNLSILVVIAVALALTAIVTLVRFAGVKAETAATIVTGVVAAVAAIVAARKDLPSADYDAGRMPLLHHVSISVRDLERSVDFYLNGLGLHRIPRAPLNFGVDGAWFELPTGQQLHILVNPAATYRPETTSRRDVWDECHFALRVGHAERKEIFERLERRNAFLADHPRVNVKRYPHFYTLDPDNHVIEVNSEPTR